MRKHETVKSMTPKIHIYVTSSHKEEYSIIAILNATTMF